MENSHGNAGSVGGALLFSCEYNYIVNEVMEKSNNITSFSNSVMPPTQGIDWFAKISKKKNIGSLGLFARRVPAFDKKKMI